MTELFPDTTAVEHLSLSAAVYKTVGIGNSRTKQHGTFGEVCLPIASNFTFVLPASMTNTLENDQVCCHRPLR
jgi:hypothetical protein